MQPEDWGVDRGYADYRGEWHEAPGDTVDGILRRLGAGDDRPHPPPSPVRVVVRDADGGWRDGDGGPSDGEGGGGHDGSAAGGRPRVEAASELTVEDGGTVRLDAGEALPADLPLGYHRLVRLDGGAATSLIVAPGACHLPDDLTEWGWTVQLYAARSSASWGMGDLGDLARLARWSADDLGAGVLAVNPLHAPLPTRPQQSSPYFPSTRRYRNPLYLRIEDVPGAAEAGTDLDRLAAAGRALNDDRLIDRDTVFALKMEALELLWSRRRSSGADGDRAFEAWRAAEGQALEDYATFCVLCERYEADQERDHWRVWDEEHRHPRSPAVARLRQEQGDRVSFHQWVQWLLDRQLAEASTHVPLIQDLAVGVDPAGADAWCWQDVLAPGFTVGAPPDEFNTRGQDWSVAPFDPWRLRGESYRPLAETFRSVLRHAGGLRVDHVMGLFRLFWVPAGSSPASGTYVRYPASDLLAVLALESVRAGAVIVGEDLGTVEPSAREALSSSKVLSYRLIWFQPEPPEHYPRQALAAVTTHDLPTVAGLWTGADLDAQRSLDMAPNEEATSSLRDRLAGALDLPHDAPPRDVVLAVHRWLGRSPSALLSATLDDALEVAERPNMPGITEGWPNWSLALPVPLDDVFADDRPKMIAAALDRRRGRGRGPESADLVADDHPPPPSE